MLNISKDDNYMLRVSEIPKKIECLHSYAEEEELRNYVINRLQEAHDWFINEAKRIAYEQQLADERNHKADDVSDIQIIEISDNEEESDSEEKSDIEVESESEEDN